VTLSALIVEVPEAEHLVAGWRRRHDPSAARGIPAHITALYPFLAPELVDDAVLGDLRAVVSSFDAFWYDLTRLEDLPGVIWLRPDPGEPFSALTRALWAAFPDHPPYGGRHLDPRPHLTLAQLDDSSARARVRRALQAALGEKLPLRCRADHLSVFSADADGNWRRRDTLRFGG
jgi:2'-5' RNA ligase